jgi:hypothetical protein
MLGRIFNGLYEPFVIYLVMCMLNSYVVCDIVIVGAYCLSQIHVTFITLVYAPHKFLQVDMVMLSNIYLSVCFNYVISYALI